MNKVALDTSVIIEYIDRKGRYHELAKAVFDSLMKGKLKVYVPHVVLAETFYIAARLFRAIGAEKPLFKAKSLVEWLYYNPRIEVIRSLEIDIEAGVIKLKYKLALTDAYVLAIAKVLGVPALFRKKEHEMIRVLDSLRRECKIMFLEDYA